MRYLRYCNAAVGTDAARKGTGGLKVQMVQYSFREVAIEHHKTCSIGTLMTFNGTTTQRGSINKGTEATIVFALYTQCISGR